MSQVNFKYEDITVEKTGCYMQWSQLFLQAHEVKPD